MENTICFRWLGAGGVELSRNDETLVIDPFFTRPPAWRMAFGRVPPNRELIAEKIRRCDYALVTHAHWDHVMDVPDLVFNTGAIALGSSNTCQLLAACGVQAAHIRQIGAGDRLRLGSFRVEVLPARHLPIPGFSPGPLPSNLKAPLRLRDYRMDTCFSFLIQVAELRLLDWESVHPGSAPRADALFVGLAGGDARYEALLRAVQPRLIVPIHWDNLFRPLSRPLRPLFGALAWSFPPLQRLDPARFKTRIEGMAPGTSVLVPEAFRAYDLRRICA